jgi:hypothetical protein
LYTFLLSQAENKQSESTRATARREAEIWRPREKAGEAETWRPQEEVETLLERPWYSSIPRLAGKREAEIWRPREKAGEAETWRRSKHGGHEKKTEEAEIWRPRKED